MSTALEILRRYWGHQTFRPLQDRIVKKVLEGDDVLALLPTGGGKSVCFQVPTLMRPGICLVISPLVALMQDQVDGLKQKGIKAMALTGHIPIGELDNLLDNCIYGDYKFLYMSPERLQHDLVQERIKKMNLSLIAVDEAHCISQWGHDFRPAYRNIKILRDLKPETPVIALTATATPTVAKDIQEQLGFSEPQILQKSFARANIAYEVVSGQEKRHWLEKLISEQAASGIVYVRSRRKTIDISSFLEKQGISATYYHGGLPQRIKSTRLQQWLLGRKRIMVATSAFGMGIDKADVRSVIHMDLPESLESYFQQAGRAGRDGLPARAVVLTGQKDEFHLQNQFLHTLPDLEFTKLVYKKLMAYFRIAYGEGAGEHFNYNFQDFCRTYKLERLKTYNTLQLLERLGILQLSESLEKKTRIQVLSSHRQLEETFKRNPHFMALMQTILRTYGGIFEGMVSINLLQVCQRASVSVEKALDIFQAFADQSLIAFEHELHDSGLSLLVPREDETSINPHAPFIAQYQQSRKEKINAVLDYVLNDKACKSQQLLEYFGETMTIPCGICSVCQRRAPEKLTRDEMNNIYLSIRKVLRGGALTSQEITSRLLYDEKSVLNILQLLVEKGVLKLTPSKTYKLSKQ